MSAELNTELLVVIESIRRLHREHEDEIDENIVYFGVCVDCCQNYPCETIQILDGAGV